MIRRCHLFAFILIMMNLGCATIFEGTSQNIRVGTNVNATLKAQVIYTNGSEDVSIPGVIKVKRSKDAVVIKVKEDQCYEESYKTIYPRDENGQLFVLNFLNLGIGSLTDAALESMWAYDEVVNVTVKKKSSCQ